MDRFEPKQFPLNGRFDRRAENAKSSASTPSYVSRKVLISAAVCLLTLTRPAMALAANISVCASGCDQTSVADAVAAAANGDTIVIGAGTLQSARCRPPVGTPRIRQQSTPVYGKPCFTINLNPGQTLPVSFGNSK